MIFYEEIWSCEFTEVDMNIQWVCQQNYHHHHHQQRHMIMIIIMMMMMMMMIIIIIIIIIIKLKADVDLLHHTNTDAYNVFLRLITLPGSMFPTLYKQQCGSFYISQESELWKSWHNKVCFAKCICCFRDDFPKNYGQNHCPRMQKVHFQLTCIA